MNAAQFKELFPAGEFNAVDDSTALFTTAKKRADLYFDVDRWQQAGMYEEGYANCVAHFMVLLKAQSAKSIAQESAGDVASRSISGAVAQTRDSQMINREAADPFMRTSYGQQYAYLRDIVGVGGA